MPCVSGGEALRLHVATDARRFSVRLIRWGAQPEDATPAVHSFPGEDAPPGRPEAPWKWPQYEIHIDKSLPPGVYAAVLQTGNDGDLHFDARAGRALFIVRPPRTRAPLLVVLPLFTYHAYNIAHVDGTLGIDEGDCLYSGSQWVTLHRPGGGTGGHPWDEVNADVYDRDSPRQTFVHWDGKALGWLERNGIAYECCSDLELHAGSIDLGAYRAVASFGHHEYWSDAMRERIEAFTAAGGNVAFFGGNTCWFRVEYDAARKAIRRLGRWECDPEWYFTGVSYACGGGKWIGERPPTGYTVKHPLHWIFAGTNLSQGDVFGAEQRLVGYECDGAPEESDAHILASASIRDWEGAGCEVSQSGCAHMAVREAGGMIFTASTVDWARVLERHEPHVARITRNVLERFLS